MADIEFTAPEGFEIPENKKEGDTFDSVATLRIEAGGKLCLEALDGMSVEGAKDKKDDQPEAEPQEDMGGPTQGSDFLSAVEKGAKG